MPEFTEHAGHPSGPVSGQCLSISERNQREQLDQDQHYNFIPDFSCQSPPGFSRMQFCFILQTHTTTRREGLVDENMTQHPHRNIYSHLLPFNNTSDQSSPSTRGSPAGVRAEMTFGVSGRAASSTVSFYCPTQMFSSTCF